MTLTFAAAFPIVLHTLAGQTIGKAAANVKVIDHKTEKDITFKQALLRDCVPIAFLAFIIIIQSLITISPDAEIPTWYTNSLLTFIFVLFTWHLLEIITMLFNKKNRAIHDYIAGTVVVRT